ncbi:MAG: succinate dehydrogenase assembly factor 2 [Pigmentiphaga sp.]|nr:succinate dehydrogenase assembly factor 2 [Pigmentiphaga sp.]
MPGKPLDPRARLRLRWRARRGLLENDLIITRFLDANEARLTDDDVATLTALLALDDTDLLDLLLGRTEPEGELDVPEVHRLLAGLRAA